MSRFQTTKWNAESEVIHNLIACAQGVLLLIFVSHEGQGSALLSIVFVLLSRQSDVDVYETRADGTGVIDSGKTKTNNNKADPSPLVEAVRWLSRW